MKVPRTWIQEEKFLRMIPFFLTRFVIDYHDDGSDWQICTMNSCELKGNGVDEFVQTLSPPKEDANNGAN